ncbi:Interferon-inducible GTPase 5 [Fusarium oxysporum f. sp. cubense race 1]|uniref:Interferon-inducible GTPase 5 n=1 Tax=Fusarium oxysporum f. sp. cubense (strain race 1) TaxID=1229664 RepID=N4UU51_FUSC1|nr:Interferon-inducible GTPase 5 [Fusarium oxysporum f. sp. cubense race 1]
MSFFSTPDDSDDEGFTVRPTFFPIDLNELVGGGSPASNPNSQFQSQSNGSDSEVIGYDDIMRFFNIARGAVGLANMIRGEARHETLAQAAHQANERAEREEGRRREAEEQTSVAQAVALAAQDAAETAQAAAEAAQAEVKATQKRLKLVEELYRLGIEPDREVTDEEVRTARLGVGYVNDMTNIGVVGDQNDGKSTLVNCFRGVAHSAPESAMTGETEVTRRSAAYPDDKHIGVVWHDISGGGTTYTTAWRYYYNQKLFAYDKLVLAHSSTLSEILLGNISMASQHIKGAADIVQAAGGPQELGLSRLCLVSCPAVYTQPHSGWRLIFATNPNFMKASMAQ